MVHAAVLEPGLGTLIQRVPGRLIPLGGSDRCPLARRCSVCVPRREFGGLPFIGTARSAERACALRRVTAAHTSMAKRRPTVFIVDDSSSVRSALRRFFTSSSLATDVHASAGSFLDAYDGRPGCLILGASLPDLDGLDVLDQLTAQGSWIPTILLTARSDMRLAVGAMKRGARDVLEKSVRTDVLLDRVHTCIDEDEKHRSRRRQWARLDERFKCLTPREDEITRLVVKGRRTKEIATNLGISHKTVESHRARINSKLRVASLAELVQLAHNHTTGKKLFDQRERSLPAERRATMSD